MTEPTRDLVDREEKPISDDEILAALRGWCATGTTLRVAADRIEELLAEVAALRAVECPRGWTRDEVLHELDTHPGAVCEQQSMQMAEWFTVPTGAIGSWHPEVRRYDVRVVLPEPPVTVWVPLTKLVGRTLPGETVKVAGEPFYISGKGWHYQDADRWVHGIPVDLESGRVEVLAEGDA